MTSSKDRILSGSDHDSRTVKKERHPLRDKAPGRAHPGETAGSQEDLPEPQLVKLAVSGNKEAFEVLFKRYKERVYRTAYGWCYDAQIALDITQDVFIKTYRSLERFRSESSIWTWICRITINRCLDYVRKKERSKEISVESPEEIVPSNVKVAIDPSEELEFRELKGALSCAIKNLSPEAKSAFTLRFFDDLSYREIAKALDCSVGTVMSRLFYARQKLKDMLQNYL